VTTERDDPERLAWLRLARSRGLGTILFFRLIERFGKASAVIEALPRLESKLAAKGFALATERSVDEEVAALDRLGARLLLAFEPDYPLPLRNIADPPPVLVLLGRADLLAARMVAVVGARNASGNGRFFATTLARALSERDLTVVSGLARGIDTAAHQGGLEGKGATIAVLGSGIDVVYPPENAELHARIAAEGLIVSERAPGTPPLARHFPRRNRIIAGLASAVVVVEAAARSGSLMTARLAGSEGREVMAVPGSPLDPRHAGTNQLLRDGAALVTGIEDVMAALPSWTTAAPARQVKPRSEAAATRPRMSATDRPKLADSGAQPALAALPETIATLLGIEPIPVDEVIRQCHATPSQVQDALLDLELDGRVRRHPGNRISRALA
jgi:DNA processing protein